MHLLHALAKFHFGGHFFVALEMIECVNPLLFQKWSKGLQIFANFSNLKRVADASIHSRGRKSRRKIELNRSLGRSKFRSEYQQQMTIQAEPF